MPASAAVQLEGVSKRFLISHRRGSGLKDRVIAALHGERDRRDVLWALRGVTLDITQGETLAIIGPNGGGKSTLLQIIAGILVPDEGRTWVAGRVTSLLPPAVSVQRPRRLSRREATTGQRAQCRRVGRVAGAGD